MRLKKEYNIDDFLSDSTLDISFDKLKMFEVNLKSSLVFRIFEQLKDFKLIKRSRSRAF